MGQSSSNQPAVEIASPACPASPATGSISNTVTLGAGCYWGTEKFIRKDFQKLFPNSIKTATVGFMSPDPNAPKNPSYQAVCSGSTGHVEVLLVELNDPNAHFEELVRFFYMFHDPTTKNRQGNDMGSQYASFIFTCDAKQEAIAMTVSQQLQDCISRGTLSCFSGDTVKTSISSKQTFYKAERVHQDYLANNPGGYCNHYMRFKQWPSM